MDNSIGKKMAGFLGVLASIAGILGLFVTLNILHPLVPNPPLTPTSVVFSPTLTPTSPAGTCIQGYVWREAFPNDHVCVTPAARALAQYDNTQNPNRTNTDGTCIQGYVWREAFPTDHVCVTPATRTQTQDDNSQAQNRTASP